MFQHQLTDTISHLFHAIQELIGRLYTNMKSPFIEPANSTMQGMLKKSIAMPWKKVWFNSEWDFAYIMF